MPNPYKSIVADLPPAEQQGVIEALRLLAAETDPEAYQAGLRIIKTYARVVRKRASDHATDHARRVLVGARVPREDAARYRAAAHALDISLYAWVHQALDAYADAGPWSPSP